VSAFAWLLMRGDVEAGLGNSPDSSTADASAPPVEVVLPAGCFAPDLAEASTGDASAPPVEVVLLAGCFAPDLAEALGEHGSSPSVEERPLALSDVGDLGECDAAESLEIERRLTALDGSGSTPLLAGRPLASSDSGGTAGERLAVFGLPGALADSGAASTFSGPPPDFGVPAA